MGQNYIDHLGVYRTDFLRAIGGFREGLEGSQDYDLAFRCIERLKPDQIRHHPTDSLSLAHGLGSLAEKRDAKPYAKEAARRAIADHLQRMESQVEQKPARKTSSRIVSSMICRTQRRAWRSLSMAMRC